ncbi:unnamed protein product [Didymodactylos carnosus]|uniref:Uncharacterized protein n=1 Tax=Didymodactylos carnosus TaxID=1234261 RepID=A0A815A9H5_9BILA|nr:unnamed protein product [Didymodactylos carnosus]CAF4025903.1 unnamed protein product [Didymodactylos carnosus]
MHTLNSDVYLAQLDRLHAAIQAKTPQKEPHRLPSRQRQAPCRASSDRIDRREGLAFAPTPAILSHGSSLGLPHQPLIEKLDGE